MSVSNQLNEIGAVRTLALAKDTLNFDVEKANIEPHVLYFRKSLKGASDIVPLVRKEDKIVDGVRNIDSAKLVGGEAFFCTKVIVSGGTVAGDTFTDDVIKAVKVTNSVASCSPFGSSKITVEVNKKEMFAGITNHLLPSKTSDDVFGQGKSGYQVPAFLIPSNKEIIPKIELFTAVDSAEKPVIEFAMIGYKITENV